MNNDELPAGQAASEALQFDTYEIYYRGELIAEVKDYRKGFATVFYDLSDITLIKNGEEQ